MNVLAAALLIAASLALPDKPSGVGEDALGAGARAPADEVPAQDAEPSPPGGIDGIRLREIGRFREPVFITGPPGDPRRLFVVERAGRILVVRGGRVLDRPFLDIRGRVSTIGYEQGLLSMAFAPDYARSGRFYVYFSGRDENIHLWEFRRSRNPDRANRRSRREVLFVRHPASTAGPAPREDRRVHYGGQIAFGPDRLLYVGIGDGGGQGDPRGRGQDLGTPLGKILRIDPRPSRSRPYRIPAGNPFVGRRGARAAIYAYGLRNPYRFTFDRRTGDLAIGDVGQNRVEEIDFRKRGTGAGANFGWKCFEGSQRFGACRAPGHVPPVIERPSSSIGRCASIIGGYVVRDKGLPALEGRYIYTDFCTGRLRSARLRARRAVNDHDLGLVIPWVSSFGEDARGRVYAASFFTGAVYRLSGR